MKRLKIVADDKIPFLKGVLEPYAEMVYLPGGKIGRSDVADADALITRTRTVCDRALLENSRVRFVATATIGFDHIRTAELAALGIAWTNAPGCNAASVAQYIAAALTAFDGKPLAGRTLGVVGVGNVGRKIVAVGEALGMNVLCNDPPRAEKEPDAKFLPLEELVKKSDFLTFHVPLIREGIFRTFHLADEALLSQLQPNAVVLNSARGEVVDNQALKQRLLLRKLGGAVLDVWENEPNFDRELQKLVRFGTPHIAGYSTDGKANGTGMAVRAIAKFFQIGELTEFEVPRLPVPENTRIHFPSGGSEADKIRVALRQSYDIAADDAALRRAPEAFETLRGNYPIRRESNAFVIPASAPEPLKKLGFNVQ